MLRVLSVIASEMAKVESRVYPGGRPRKRALVALFVALVVAALAGCGGGGGSSEPAVEAQQIGGAGFAFAAPSAWRVTRAARSSIARSTDGPELASVTVLTLRKRYRPALFRGAARELDRITTALATKLGGKVIASRTIVVGGIKSRQYDLAYARAGTGLIDRVTYVLRGKSEYYLLCRWPADAGESDACGLLTTSFRIR
jgi:hypothetical protein